MREKDPHTPPAGVAAALVLSGALTGVPTNPPDGVTTPRHGIESPVHPDVFQEIQDQRTAVALNIYNRATFVQLSSEQLFFCGDTFFSQACYLKFGQDPYTRATHIWLEKAVNCYGEAVKRRHKEAAEKLRVISEILARVGQTRGANQINAFLEALM